MGLGKSNGGIGGLKPYNEIRIEIDINIIYQQDKYIEKQICKKLRINNKSKNKSKKKEEINKKI
ncbi:hypothetical protein [Clostridium sp.]|uniref:hypothetical protein n=1 Tax=Clostridium sp. TaxID=1506 RepID=UPI00261FB59E|nr:hypothetical protein [Clostridium sp.]